MIAAAEGLIRGAYSGKDGRVYLGEKIHIASLNGKPLCDRLSARHTGSFDAWVEARGAIRATCRICTARSQGRFFEPYAD